MKAAISRALSAIGRRLGGISGCHAQVSRSRWARPRARASRRARVDFPEPEFPKMTTRLMAGARGNHGCGLQVEDGRAFYSPGNDDRGLAIHGSSGHAGRVETAK